MPNDPELFDSADPKLLRLQAEKVNDLSFERRRITEFLVAKIMFHGEKQVVVRRRVGKIGSRVGLPIRSGHFSGGRARYEGRDIVALWTFQT